MAVINIYLILSQNTDDMLGIVLGMTVAYKKLGLKILSKSLLLLWRGRRGSNSRPSA